MLNTKDIEIEGLKFKIKELNTEEGLELAKFDRTQVNQMAKDILKKSIIEPKDLKLEELPFRIGNKLMLEINKINGLGEGFTAVPEILQTSQSGK